MSVYYRGRVAVVVPSGNGVNGIGVAICEGSTARCVVLDSGIDGDQNIYLCLMSYRTKDGRK